MSDHYYITAGCQFIHQNEPVQEIVFSFLAARPLDFRWVGMEVDAAGREKKNITQMAAFESHPHSSK